MGERQITQSALGWLRETDSLTMNALRRAYWEKLVPEAESYGTATVRNESYGHEADEHTHTVGVSQHGIVHHCSCAHFRYNDKMCKHMIATAMAIDDGTLDLTEIGAKEDVIARADPQTQV